MLQENIVKNDSMCDLLCYCFIVKLQNFLIVPRTVSTSMSSSRPDALFEQVFFVWPDLYHQQRPHQTERLVQVLDVLDAVHTNDVRLLQRTNQLQQHIHARIASLIDVFFKNMCNCPTYTVHFIFSMYCFVCIILTCTCI